MDLLIGGALYSVVIPAVLINPRIRRVELELPDAIAETGLDERKHLPNRRMLGVKSEC